MAEAKKKEWNVLVTETQTYYLTVKAETEDEAARLAEEGEGEQGDPSAQLEYGTPEPA